jgi:hypothetical protein
MFVIIISFLIFKFQFNKQLNLLCKNLLNILFETKIKLQILREINYTYDTYNTVECGVWTHLTTYTYTQTATYFL